MKYRMLIFFQIATAVGLIGFWTAFFTIGLAPESPPPGYFVYEHAFPLPDAVLALGLLIAAFGRLRGAAYARPVTLACAGALIFLGLVDFSFNIQNGMYAISAVDGALNAFINVWSAGFGAWTLGLAVMEDR